MNPLPPKDDILLEFSHGLWERIEQARVGQYGLLHHVPDGDEEGYPYIRYSFCGHFFIQVRLTVMDGIFRVQFGMGSQEYFTSPGKPLDVSQECPDSDDQAIEIFRRLVGEADDLYFQDRGARPEA